MICFPNCKINIGLYITRKRDDGYHDLETVFFPLIRRSLSEGGLISRSFSEGGLIRRSFGEGGLIRRSFSEGGLIRRSFSEGGSPSLSEGGLRDVLEVVPAQTTALHQSGRSVAGDQHDNLVWKAYHLLQSRLPGKVPSLDIYLHKAIPMGAGLGGGSADGAFMLRLLNHYCGLQLSNDELAALALQLGSDCPFFIYNQPQFATGRGELMTDIAVDLSAYSIQLVCPQVHVSTASAFKMITPRPAPFDLRNLPQLPIDQWKNTISNDFEKPVYDQHPLLAHIKEQLYRQGAIYASMSGSGSAIFGIFPKTQKAEIKVNVAFEQFYIE